MKRLLPILFLCCAVARADRPPDWLRLPSDHDPRPANASGWILEYQVRFEQQANGDLLQRTRFATMILNDAGAKLAVWSLPPYLAGSTSIESAHAWVLSPDGKKCREFYDTEFVIQSLQVNSWYWDQEKVISFNATRYLQPGWILAFEVVQRSKSDPFDINWNAQNQLPVRHARLELVPRPGGAVRWLAFSKDMQAPAGSAPNGGHVWDLADVPAFDVNVPAEFTTWGRQIRGYLLDSPETSRTWADVARLVREQMDPQETATPAMADQARRLAAAGSLWSRIRPVCQFAQKEISYLEINIATDAMAGYRPHTASEVCTNRYGDCKDKAVLLCAMLRSLGVEAYPFLLNSEVPTMNREDWPSGAFNHAIVAIACAEAAPPDATTVRVSGKDYLLFDPTDEYVPLGLLPRSDVGGLGLLLAPLVAAPVRIPLPPSDYLLEDTRVDVVLTGDGSGAVTVTDSRHGVRAAEMSNQDKTLPLAERTGEFERAIQKRVPLVSDLTWTSASDDDAHSWTRNARFSAKNLADTVSGDMYVPTDLLSNLPGTHSWPETDQGWVAVVPRTERRVVQVTLPQSWDLSEMPADWSLASDAGSGTAHYSRDGNTVTAEFTLKVNGGILERASYLGFRDLVHAAAEAERRPLVLRQAAGAAKPTS